MNPIVTAIVGPLISMITSALGINTETDDTKVKLAAIAIEAQTLVSQQLIAQANTNQQEAASGNKFAADWRPFIGWVCGAAFAYHFLLQPCLIFLLSIVHVTVAMPAFDMNTLYTVLMGMLGLGGMRTYESTQQTDS